jgi:hypothetical protein
LAHSLARVIARVRQEDAVANQPAYVREAARRVLETARQQMRLDELRTTATIDVTNRPNVTRGFDAMGLGEGQAQLSFEYMTPTTAARLSAGFFSPKFSGGEQQFTSDGSYVAQKVGGAVFYVLDSIPFQCGTCVLGFGNLSFGQIRR